MLSADKKKHWNFHNLKKMTLGVKIEDTTKCSNFVSLMMMMTLMLTEWMSSSETKKKAVNCQLAK